MDIKLLIKSMNEEEKQKAYWHLQAWNRSKQESIGKKIKLTKEEQSKVDDGREVEAVKMLRERIGGELLACRYAVQFSRKP